MFKKHLSVANKTCGEINRGWPRNIFNSFHVDERQNESNKRNSGLIVYFKSWVLMKMIMSSPRGRSITIGNIKRSYNEKFQDPKSAFEYLDKQSWLWDKWNIMTPLSIHI